MPEPHDQHASAIAAFDQMAAWYKSISVFLANVQDECLSAGIDHETTRVIVAQQHKKLLEKIYENED